MWMTQLTIMNHSIGKYTLIVSDGREYGELSEVELIAKIEYLLSEGMAEAKTERGK